MLEKIVSINKNKFELKTIPGEFLKMINNGLVDYCWLRRKLCRYYINEPDEALIIEFILERTVLFHKAFEFIKSKEFTQGKYYGSKVITEGTNLNPKRVLKALKGLVDKGIIFIHTFQKTSGKLYLINTPENRKIYKKLLSGKLTKTDIEDLNSDKVLAGRLKRKRSKVKPEMEQSSGQIGDNFEPKRTEVKSETAETKTSETKSIKESKPQKSAVTNKRNINKITNKNNKQKNSEKSAADNFKNCDEVNELIALLKNSTYKGKNIDFNTDFVLPYIKTGYIGNDKTSEVIKNQVEWLPYQSQKNLDKYGAAKVLFFCIRDNKPCPEKYRKKLDEKLLQEESKEMLPLLNIWDSANTYDSISKKQAKWIISVIVSNIYKNIIKSEDRIYKLNKTIELVKKIIETNKIVNFTELVKGFVDSKTVNSILELVKEKQALIESEAA